MNKSDAVNKARELRAGGKTEEQITATIFNLGFAEDEVAKIIEESKKAPTNPPKSEESKKPSAKKKKSWWPFGK